MLPYHSILGMCNSGKEMNCHQQYANGKRSFYLLPLPQD